MLSLPGVFLVSGSVFYPGYKVLGDGYAYKGCPGGRSGNPAGLFDFSGSGPEASSVLSSRVPRICSMRSRERSRKATTCLGRLCPGVSSRVVRGFPFGRPEDKRLRVVRSVGSTVEGNCGCVVLRTKANANGSTVTAALTGVCRSTCVLAVAGRLRTRCSGRFRFPLIGNEGGFTYLRSGLRSAYSVNTYGASPASDGFFYPCNITGGPALSTRLTFRSSSKKAMFCRSDKRYRC